MDFIAIDFETPNSKNHSICAMGFTLVKNDQIIESKEELINPCDTFSGMNIAIHGITKDIVAEKPTLAQIWPNYEGFFRHYPIVMHNAPFDAAVLSKAAKRAGLVLPDMDFYCTLQLCRENFGWEDCRLNAVCEKFGFALNHHHCASDSECTAKIMLELVKNPSTHIHTSLSACKFCVKRDEWVKKDQKSIVSAASAPCLTIRVPFAPDQSIQKNQADTIVTPDCDYQSTDIAFDGKRFVFTGALPGVGRKEAVSFVEARGGSVSSSVSKKTDYVIIGVEDLTLVGQDGKSTKIEKAEALIQQGFPIRLIKAEDFCSYMQK